MKGRQIIYSPDELEWLERNRLMVIGDYHRAFVEAFGRNDVAPGHLHALRKRKGWKTGRTGCFLPGQEPVNKGTKCPPGRGGRHPNAQRTQFKAGGRTGKAAILYKPIGTERVSKDGYVERKVHDGMPPQSRWRTVQSIRWEEANGALPDGHFLKCLDGNKLNTDPDNWEALPRALLPILNGGRFKTRLAYDEAHHEVRPTILALAKLGHATKKSRAAPTNNPAHDP